jgi:hypothetical protein
MDLEGADWSGNVGIHDNGRSEAAATRQGGLCQGRVLSGVAFAEVLQEGSAHQKGKPAVHA